MVQACMLHEPIKFLKRGLYKGLYGGLLRLFRGILGVSRMAHMSRHNIVSQPSEKDMA